MLVSLWSLPAELQVALGADGVEGGLGGACLGRVGHDYTGIPGQPHGVLLGGLRYGHYQVSK